MANYLTYYFAIALVAYIEPLLNKGNTEAKRQKLERFLNRLH